MTMPARRILAIAFFAAAAIALLPNESIAQTQYYWDQNGTDPGFGIASGTWGITTARISTSSAGTATPVINPPTTTADTLNLGTDMLGLTTGTITVNATRNIGSIIRGSASNSGIIQVNGGTTTFAATGAVTNNGDTTSFYMGTTIAGGSTSMTFTTSNVGLANIQITNVANTYGGATIIGEDSTVRITVNGLLNGGVNSALGSSSSAASNLVFENGGHLWYQSVATSTNRNFTINGASATLQARGTGVLTWTGTASYGGPANEAKTLNLASSNAGTEGGTFSGILVDNGSGQLSLVKSGSSDTAANHWTLDNANTFTGSTTISGGILVLGNTNALQNSYINTTASATGNTTTGLRTTGAALNLGGLSGNKALSTIYTTSTGGYGSVTGITLNVASANNLSYSGVIDGGRSLTKSGDGTQALSGTNAYTGTTTVSNGTLRVNGTHTGGAAYTVDSGATLQGTGSTTSVLNIAGTLSPGASIETFGSNALSFSNNSTFQYEVDSVIGPIDGADLQIVNGASNTGNLTLTGTVNLTITDLAGMAATPFAPDTTFTLINYNGVWNSGLFTFGGNAIANNDTFTAGLNTWRLNYDAASGGSNFSSQYLLPTSSFVNIIAVPEPATIALLGAGVALLGFRRARRRKA